ncbi:MAG: hypothetical protein GF405_09970 [Candidatus Eisenbacteria bacterium]|nr:hypothetical protein [Candidatus Eisenbacteria bacterium]
MSRVYDVPVHEITPGSETVFRALGVPSDREPTEQASGVFEQSLRVFRDLCRARGIARDVDADTFARIYDGEGDNESPAPLEMIFPRAEQLTLFVVTLGHELSDRIRALFDEGDIALGATLDAVASEGTELAAEWLERRLDDEWAAAGGLSEGAVSLRYSPGYCGWNVTGQRALFAELRPEAIDVRLNESCLMEPLKSISGVVVTGPPAIHRFDDDYAFCSVCRTRECRARIDALDAAATDDN